MRPGANYTSGRAIESMIRPLRRIAFKIVDVIIVAFFDQTSREQKIKI